MKRVEPEHSQYNHKEIIMQETELIAALKKYNSNKLNELIHKAYDGKFILRSLVHGYIQVIWDRTLIRVRIYLYEENNEALIYSNSLSGLVDGGSSEQIVKFKNQILTLIDPKFHDTLHDVFEDASMHMHVVCERKFLFYN